MSVVDSGFVVVETGHHLHKGNGKVRRILILCHTVLFLCFCSGKSRRCFFLSILLPQFISPTAWQESSLCLLGSLNKTVCMFKVGGKQRPGSCLMGSSGCFLFPATHGLSLQTFRTSLCFHVCPVSFSWLRFSRGPTQSLGPKQRLFASDYHDENIPLSDCVCVWEQGGAWVWMGECAEYLVVVYWVGLDWFCSAAWVNDVILLQ